MERPFEWEGTKNMIYYGKKGTRPKSYYSVNENVCVLAYKSGFVFLYFVLKIDRFWENCILKGGGASSFFSGPYPNVSAD